MLLCVYQKKIDTCLWSKEKSNNYGYKKNNKPNKKNCKT